MGRKLKTIEAGYLNSVFLHFSFPCWPLKTQWCFGSFCAVLSSCICKLYVNILLFWRLIGLAWGFWILGCRRLGMSCHSCDKMCLLGKMDIPDFIACLLTKSDSFCKGLSELWSFIEPPAGSTLGQHRREDCCRQLQWEDTWVEELGEDRVFFTWEWDYSPRSDEFGMVLETLQTVDSAKTAIRAIWGNRCRLKLYPKHDPNHQQQQPVTHPSNKTHRFFQKLSPKSPTLPTPSNLFHHNLRMLSGIEQTSPICVDAGLASGSLKTTRRQRLMTLGASLLPPLAMLIFPLGGWVWVVGCRDPKILCLFWVVPIGKRRARHWVYGSTSK